MKFREIKLMRYITKINTDCFPIAIILALTIFGKDLPNIIGQKSSCGEPKTRKSVGYLILPHKTLTSLTIPSGVMVSLLASLK